MIGEYTWRKSSHSGNQGGACVEIGFPAGAVAVRDSQDPDGGVLTFAPAAWGDFVQLVKDKNPGH